jgi:hypothetical protein
MPQTIGQHSIAAFVSPVNGTSPIDANQVRGNDNTIRTAYNSHDSDSGVHLQSSTLAARPASGTTGRKWMTVDGNEVRVWFDAGSSWVEVSSIARAEISDTAPTSPVTGALWYRSTDGRSFIYYDNFWVQTF